MPAVLAVLLFRPRQRPSAVQSTLAGRTTIGDRPTASATNCIRERTCRHDIRERGPISLLANAGNQAFRCGVTPVVTIRLSMQLVAKPEGNDDPWTCSSSDCCHDETGVDERTVTTVTTALVGEVGIGPDERAVAAHPLKSLLEVVRVSPVGVAEVVHEVGCSPGVSRLARILSGLGFAHQVVGRTGLSAATVWRLVGEPSHASISSRSLEADGSSTDGSEEIGEADCELDGEVGGRGHGVTNLVQQSGDDAHRRSVLNGRAHRTAASKP